MKTCAEIKMFDDNVEMLYRRCINYTHKEICSFIVSHFGNEVDFPDPYEHVCSFLHKHVFMIMMNRKICSFLCNESRPVTIKHSQTCSSN